MTQADASEPEADDFVADSVVDHAPADTNMVDVDKAAAAMPSTSNGAPRATGVTIGSADLSPAAESGLPAEHAELAEQPQSRADASRGAGTPAGPQEEFYSPQEHFQGEASEQHHVSVHHNPEVAATAADQTRLVVNDSRPVVKEMGTTANDQTRPAQSAMTPLNHKTPAPTKRRKGSKR